jgi:hypothetical protein
MAEIVQSLFGVTPEMYQQNQQARADQQALQYAQLTPFQQANFAIGRGANMLGGAIGRGLGGEDPELARITARQQISGQINYSDPTSIARGVQMLSQAGDSQGAMMLADVGRKAESEMALAAQRNAAAGRERQQAIPPQLLISDRIAQLNTQLDTLSQQPASPERDAQLNLTTRRLEAIQQQVEKAPKTVVVGNVLVDAVTGAEIYKGPDTQKYSEFAKTLTEAGLTPGSEPFQKRMLEYATKKVEGAGKGTGNVTIGGINVDTGAAAKKAGEIIGTNVANIENQFSLQTAYTDALTLLDQGIYAGAFGPEQTAATKYSLGSLGNQKKLENTEVFLANIGEIVIPRLVQFGGNDSNEELKYLQNVVAGNQRLEPGSMKRILKNAEKKVQNNIKRLTLQTQAAEGGTKLPISPVTAPTQTPTKRYNPQTRQLETVKGD